ncbi:flagellar protein FlaG [Brevibacillus choshinensis]|uniref:Flagellar protein FlaG n=1 Tax=Brevibacillus choshinensis TaxID=54911 RepID=A0ABX7FM22_BRECH|nr:flagellar protein FlaG [Brevibacillus choshinensis]QRG67309.1 flagellar protein FlaG [Brevibacillus choshinensis]
MEIRLPNQAGAVIKSTGLENQGTGPKAIEGPVETNDAEKKNSPEELEKAIAGLNKWMQTESTHLQFRMHEKMKEYYVEVVNDVTNEVIRQIPSKKILDISAKMQEMIGLLVDEKR